MRDRRVLRATAIACLAAAGLALPGAAGADWSAPSDLPVTRAEQVEATMSPQGTATIAAAGIAGPTDVYARGPKRGAAFKLVRWFGPCSDVSSCPFVLDAGAERAFALVSEDKRDAQIGVESSLGALLRSPDGVFSGEVLAGPQPGTSGYGSRVASGGSRRAVASWYEGGQLVAAIKGARADGFGSPQPLAGADATEPALAMGPQGTAAIAFLDAGQNLTVLRRAAGEEWVGGVASLASGAVATAVNDKGRIFTTYNDAGQLWVNAFRAEDTAPLNSAALCFGGPAQSAPDLETGPDGRARLAFVDPAGDLRVTSSAGTCRDPLVIDTNAPTEYALDVRGERAVLAWIDALPNSTPEQPRYALRARTGPVDRLGLAKTVRVGGNPDQVSAAIDAKGNAIVAYRRTTEERELGVEQLSFRAPRP